MSVEYGKRQADCSDIKQSIQGIKLNDSITQSTIIALLSLIPEEKPNSYRFKKNQTHLCCAGR